MKEHGMDDAPGNGARPAADRPGAAAGSPHPAEAFDLLALFSFMWGTTALIHLFRPSTILAVQQFDVEGAANLAMCLLALALVLRPRSIDLLFLLAATQVFEYILSMPIGSNHYTITFFLNSAICCSYLFFKAKRPKGAPPREAFFNSWSAVGRYVLVLTYFFGVFHKINTDWFDPAVSCAVTLTDSLVVPWGLKFPGLDQIVIYGTLAVEGLAMILLCTPRFKYVGFLIGMPLHIIIGLVPYNWYPNFSALMFALYALFLPGDFPARLQKIFGQYSFLRVFEPVSRNLKTTVIVFGGVILLSALAVQVFVDPLGSSDTAIAERKLMHDILRMFWAVYSVVIYGFFVVLLWRESFPVSREYWLPEPRLILLIPVIFLLNGFSPYLGLKTDGTISMYSNLHTEASVTNHLLLSRPPYLFDYQRNVVKVLASSDAELQEVADRDLDLIEFDFWRQVQERPDGSVTYQKGDDVRQLSRAGDALPGHEQPLALRKLLAFKKVDFDRPKPCSH
jgi:hypothetical protein